MAGMSLEKGQQIIDSSLVELSHAVRHLSAGVVAVTSAKVGLGAVGAAGIHADELAKVVAILENTVKSMKSSAEGVQMARAGLQELTGGTPDGIAVHPT